jgi:hypothetical protein
VFSDKTLNVIKMEIKNVEKIILKLNSLFGGKKGFE